MSDTPKKDSPWGGSSLLLFVLLVGLLAYAFLAAPVTVTLDGYSHLYGATVLEWMWRGAPEARGSFSYNTFLLPNWLSALALAGLSSVVPPELALKVLVVSIAALFVFSLHFCLSAASFSRRQRAQLLIGMLPLTLNGFLILGYYGFLISTSLCLLVLGLLLRHGLAMRMRLQLTCASLLMLAYTAHPFPVLVSLLFPFAYVLADVVAGRRRLAREGTLRGGTFSDALLRALRANALATWPWLLPLGPLAWFSLRLVDVEARTATTAASQIPRSTAWARDAALSISPGARAAILPIALLALLLIAVILDSRKLPERDPVRFGTLAVLVVATALLSMVAPDRVGDGSGIVMRLLFHAAAFFALLAFASALARPRLLAFCSLIAAISVIGFAWQYRLAAHRLAPGLAEVRSVLESLPAHSRILILGYRMTPLCEGGPLLKRTFPERHAALAGALANELIVLNDYQAHTSHFPLRHVTERYAGLVDEFDGYSAAQRTGWLETLASPTDVDFVVSWGLSGDPLCRITVRAPYEYSLRRSFERVRLEEGASRVALWKRRE